MLGLVHVQIFRFIRSFLTTFFETNIENMVTSIVNYKNVNEGDLRQWLRTEFGYDADGNPNFSYKVGYLAPATKPRYHKRGDRGRRNQPKLTFFLLLHSRAPNSPRCGR